MINQKKKGNNMIKFFILTTITFIITIFSFSLNAEEIKCKKYDIFCKTSNFIGDTIEYQKQSFKDGKRQIKGTTDKINKILPKNRN